MRDGGAPRPRSVRWFLCDEDTLDDPIRCAKDRSLHRYAGDGERLQLHRETLGRRRARTALVALCIGRAAQYDPARAIIACPDEAALEWPMTEGVLAFYTARVAADGLAPNRAPEIEHIRFGAHAPDPWTIRRCAAEPCPSETIVLTPSLDSAELLPSGEREALTVSFFATDGRFDRPRAVAADGGRDGSLRATFFAPTTTGRARLWLVLRDDRGASAIAERTLDVVE